MKSRVLAVLFVVLAVATAGPAAADRGGYVIRDFHTDITVADNSDIVVEERIEVDFAETRHGIYRMIPVRHTDPRGFAYSMNVRLLSVYDSNGREYETRVRNEGRYVSIRIGSASRTVRGRVTYILRYAVENALGDFPTHDELYWNATGNEWEAQILAASATVRLPVPYTSDSLEVNAYTGRFGSRAQEAEISYPEPGTVHVKALTGLNHLEGLTVSVAWPKGAIAFPGVLRRTGRFLADNWVLAMPVLFLAGLIRRYRTHGRDPAGPASVVVRYEPPEDLSAAEIGTLVDETVDLRDITASVVGLAVSGHMTIRVEERPLFLGLGKREETIFERRRETSEETLLPHQRKLLDALFSSGDTVEMKDLKNKFYKHIPGIKSALYDRLVQRGYFLGNPSSTRNIYVGLGFLFGAVVFGLGLLWTVKRGGIFPHAIIVPAAAAVLSAVPFFAFSPAMPKRTRKGVRARSWALGFEEFVERVEKDKLEADQARQVFESLLPYAMALGVSEAWARKFEGIYEAGGGPGWYVGGHPGAVFSTHAFEQSLSSSMTQAGQSMAASPRSSGSSGSGGGGFSGGGGGGGGGGSW